MIKPTISRHVWFYPGAEHAFTMKRRDEQPLHAVVIYVHGDTRVDLAITDHDGVQHVARNVILYQDESKDAPSGSYAAWMPYQRQAAAAPAATKFELGDSVAGAIAQTADAAAGLNQAIASSDDQSTTSNEGDPQ